MYSWTISSRTTDSVTVQAVSWVSALGEALQELGQLEGIGQIACECLPNGLVIVNDLDNRRRYTITPHPEEP